MSGGSFFRMMMGMVLCLMMQLPSLSGLVATGAASPAAHVGMAMPRMAGEREGMAVMARMAATVLPVRPVTRSMGDGAVPCCQGHHVSCEAGMLPGCPAVGRESGVQLAFHPHDTALSPLSRIVPPWRPPAGLPV